MCHGVRFLGISPPYGRGFLQWGRWRDPDLEERMQTVLDAVTVLRNARTSCGVERPLGRHTEFETKQEESHQIWDNLGSNAT